MRIEDVARLAGVSPITVSRTINKSDQVVEETRRAVQKAIDRLGYIPNRLAGSLASTRTRVIGLVISTLYSNIFAITVRGMTDTLLTAGYQLSLGVSNDLLEVESAHVRSFLGQRVDGVCLVGGIHDRLVRRALLQSGVPVVEINNLVSDPIDMCVGYSNEEASFAMVRHLANCGYRRIGLVTAPTENNDRSQARRAGYRRALAQLGLPFADSLIGTAPYTVAQGARAFASMLSLNPDLDALFLTQDNAAAGAILEAKRRGVRVPGDIGIAGFDDADIGQEMVPALTTVRTHHYEMGATAARMLLRRIDGGAPPQPVVDVGFEIIPRGSTRPPPA